MNGAGSDTRCIKLHWQWSKIASWRPKWPKGKPPRSGTACAIAPVYRPSPLPTTNSS
jgi:hypothetical protein